MRVAIVEDEAVVARHLVRALERILGDRLSGIETFATLDEAGEHLRRHAVDLLFLDLNVGGRSGFDLLQRALAAPCQTIVVSAHEERAITAFEYGVVDFVAKPYTDERLAIAVGRAKERDASLRERLRYLAVREGDNVRMLPIGEIERIGAAGDYSEVHCDDMSVHLHDKSLRSLQVLLPDAFLRVHRSHIVHVDKVERFRTEAGGRYALRLRSGTEVPVSRGRVATVRSRFA
jgi:DNA-binding LytR/AlgR family response regulator